MERPPFKLDMFRANVSVCRLTERATGKPIKYKANPTNPAFARENISIFLAACTDPPINLHSHDIFRSDDLVESRNLAQVLQCLGAFSRAAHRLNPSAFPTQIGGKGSGGVVSPQGTGTAKAAGSTWTGRARGESNSSQNSSTHSYARPAASVAPNRTGDNQNSGRWSPTKSTAGSTWSKGSDKGATPPPWSEFQYGSLRGANQGSLGVSFGAPRQITSASPLVPTLAEKEKLRKQKQEEEERLKLAEKERIRAEEERAQAEEDQRWAEETARVRARERLKAEEEKRQWEEEDLKWKLELDRRAKEEQEANDRLEEERRRVRSKSDVRLQGQFLSQYQAENNISRDSGREAENRDIERRVELAKQREQEYERERQSRSGVRSSQSINDQDIGVRRQTETAKARSRSRSRPRLPSRKNSEDDWKQKNERDYLRHEWSSHHGQQESQQPSRSPRPLPEPAPPVRVKTNHTGPSSRPLPDPANYVSPKETSRPFHQTQDRLDQHVQSNTGDDQPFQHRTTYSKELGAFDSVGERDAEDQRRLASQSRTTTKPRSQMTIVERAMETERLRQQEWEANLQENQKKLLSTPSRGLVGPRPPPR